MPQRKAKGRWTWAAGIVAAVIAGYLAPETAKSAVWRWIGLAGSWVATAASHPITLPFWLVALGALILGGVILLCVTLFVVAASSKGEPHFTEFTEALILGVKWAWRWSGNQIMERSLSPLCPSCDYDLRRISPTPQPGRAYDYEAASLKCDHCGREWHFEFRMPGLLDRVVREIHRRIRKGEWPGAEENDRQ